MPQITAEAIGSVTFDSAADGYEKSSVDAFLSEVSDVVRDLTARAEATSEPLLAPAEPTAAAPQDGPHDKAISETLREVAARSAAELLEAASRDAAEVLAKATEEADAVRADLAAAAEKSEEAGRVVLENARAEAVKIIEAAIDEGRTKGEAAAAELEEGMRAALKGVEAQIAAERAKHTKLVTVGDQLREDLSTLTRDALAAAADIADDVVPSVEASADPVDSGKPLSSYVVKDAEGDDNYAS